VDVGAAFVANAETPVLVEPGDRALDDLALRAQPGAVWLLRPRVEAAFPRARTSAR
jgi:hypothetical protein